MNVLRLLMLGGGLGRIWATSRTVRNVAQSVSLIAYFKLMHDIENGYQTPTLIVPTIVRTAPPPPKENLCISRKARMDNLRNHWKQLNYIANG